MRALVQRVSEAEVRAEEPDGSMVVTGSIGAGMVALVGVTHDDGDDEAERLADKIANLRIFDDDDGVMNLSALDVDAAVLVVSQFTLYGDTSKGRRPSYVGAARPEQAEPLVDRVCEELAAAGVEVATGRFGAHMEVSLVGDGPVTLLLEL